MIRRTKDYWLYHKTSRYFMNNNDVILLRKMWDSCFNLKFIDFNLSLRKIASSNYLENKFDEIHLYSHIQPPRIKNELYNKSELYNNDIIFPSDEDDWIDPSLAETLRNIETDKKFFVWNFYKTWNEEKLGPFEKTNGTITTTTCAWAVKGWTSFMERHNHLKLMKEEHSQFYFIKKPLSIKVDHLASLGFLYYKVTSKRKGREETWIDIIIKKAERDLKITGKNFPEIFQNQFMLYKNLLQELLDSRIKN